VTSALLISPDYIFVALPVAPAIMLDRDSCRKCVRLLEAFFFDRTDYLRKDFHTPRPGISYRRRT